MSKKPKDPIDIGPAIEADNVVIQGNFGGATKQTAFAAAKAEADAIRNPENDPHAMLKAWGQHQTLGRTGHAGGKPITYNNRSPALSPKGGK